MPKREAPSWDLVLKRNSVEKLKRELFPTELWGQWQRLAETSYEKLPEEDIVRLQWYGMYHDKPKIGTFMMRIKIPSGILSPSALRRIGEISEQYGRDQGELTTRQRTVRCDSARGGSCRLLLREPRVLGFAAQTQDHHLFMRVPVQRARD